MKSSYKTILPTFTLLYDAKVAKGSLDFCTCPAFNVRLITWHRLHPPSDCCINMERERDRSNKQLHKIKYKNLSLACSAASAYRENIDNLVCFCFVTHVLVNYLEENINLKWTRDNIPQLFIIRWRKKDGIAMRKTKVVSNRRRMNLKRNNIHNHRKSLGYGGDWCRKCMH